jgi:hypothetical protein
MTKIIGFLSFFLAGSLYAATISGTVTDADSDEPIAGATVILSQGGGGGGMGTPIDTTTTDASGQYSFTVSETGGHRISVTAEGYDPETGFVRVMNPDGDYTEDIALVADVPGTGSITGIITDSQSDEPIAGADVTLETGGWNGQVVATTTSGADGSYSFEGLDADTYAVEVEMEEYDFARDGGIDVGDGEAVTVDIAMDPVVMGNATITVTDAADDSPLAGATVNIRHNIGGGLGEIYTGTTDASGAVTFSDIVVGYYSATAVLADYVTETGGFMVEEGATQEVTMSMDAITNEVLLTVSGVVEDADGNAIEGATVTLRSGGGGGGGGLVLVATTDASGAYSITGIPENVDFTWLAVEANGYEMAADQVNLGGEDQEVNFVIDPVAIGSHAVSASSAGLSFGPGPILVIDNLQTSALLTIHTVKGAVIENRMVNQDRQIVPLNRIASRTVLFISLQNGVNRLKRTMFVP